MPVSDPIVAFELLLLHVPNDVASLRFVVRPKHTSVAPKIGVGSGLTVTTAVIMQPVGIV